MLDLDFKIDPIVFDIDVNLDFNKEDKNPFEKLPVYKIQKTKVKTSLELAKKIDIQKNDRTIVFSHGDFVFSDFIISLIQNNGFVADLSLSTLSLNTDNLAGLDWALKQGFVRNLKIIISDFWYQTNKYKFVPLILEMFAKYESRFEMAVCRSHCKICTIKTQNGLFISIHGSANLTSSQNLEQFMIEEGKQLFTIFNDFQNTIFNDYKLKKKTAKRNEIFNLI